MKILLLLLLSLSFTLQANDNYWPEFFKDKLLKNELSKPLAKGKITALYYSAEWCSPCQRFTPKLNAFTAANNDVFQYVYISSDRSLKQQLGCMENKKMICSAIAFNSPLKAELTKLLPKRGIPQLLVFAPNGKLISNQGRFLIENYYNSPQYGDGPGNKHALFKK